MHSQYEKEQFLYPQSRYYGSYTTENLLFNANLQEFSHKVSMISALHTGGKLSSEQAYDQIEKLWQQLAQSRQAASVDS
jgi:sigma54-dependent transcription regulator